VTTRPISQFRFSFYRRRPVHCDFSGGQITSDAGLLPLRAFDQRHHLTRDWAALLSNPSAGGDVSCRGSVRRVEDITEALWGTRVSPSTISELNQKIYAQIESWRNRRSRGAIRMCQTENTVRFRFN